MLATWTVKSGVLMKRARTAMRLVAIPMPSRAVAIGRPMASTEPKATRSTTTAASRPRPSLAGISISSKRQLANYTPPESSSGSASFFSSVDGRGGGGVVVLGQEGERRSGHLAVGGDLRRLLDGADALDGGGLLEEGGDGGGVLADVAEDEGAVLTGPGRELLLQEVVGRLGVGAGEAAAGRPLPLEGAAGHDGDDEQANPAEDDEAPALVAEAGEASEHGVLQRGRDGDETIFRGLSRHPNCPA